MLDAPYRNTSNKISYIWTPDNQKKAFSKALNPWGKAMTISALFNDFHKVLLLRNRLFHHEPIWKKHNCKSLEIAVSNVRKEYDFLMKILRYLSPDKVLLLSSIDLPVRFYNRCQVEYILQVVNNIKNILNMKSIDYHVN